MMTGALTNPDRWRQHHARRAAELTLFEREESASPLASNPHAAWAVIARRIYRHPTTISRKSEANGDRRAYRPAVAEHRSDRCLRPTESGVAGPIRPSATEPSPATGRADHLIDRADRSALMCLTDRVSRYSLLITMPNGYAAADALGGLVEGLEQFPAHLRRSITFDQGSEWAQWPALVAGYGVDAWFCDPHSPWQRGQVENLNRQWRWWFPRGTELAGITPQGGRRRCDHQRATPPQPRLPEPCRPYAAPTVRWSLELAVHL